MNKYPNYIKKYRPKGAIVKRVRDKYYVYKATSKRVEGKSYPVQVIGGLLGEITEQGFIELNKTMVDKSEVIIREYGFTNFILLHKELLLNDMNTNKRLKDRIIILNSIIVYLSNNSYLSDDNIIYSIDELVNKYNISLSKQINSIKKIIAYDFKEIECLKYICRVRMGNKTFKSTLTKQQKEIIERIGIQEDDIR